MSIPLAPAQAGIPMGGANAANATSHAKEPSAHDKEQTLEAARQFESLLLRHVLSSLEKTTSVGGHKSAANSTYQSMVVDALADGLTQAGGLGLSDLVAKMLQGEIGAAKR